MLLRSTYLAPLFIAFCLLPCSCTLFSPAMTSSDAVLTEYAGSTDTNFEFVVKNTQGLIQVRESYNSPWRFLHEGEKVQPGYSIRTGFNSSAELVMVEKGRELEIKLASLLPEIELYDLYDKLLSKEGHSKYILDQCGKKGECATARPVTVCGNTIDPSGTNDFLAVANMNLDMKNQQAGRASAVGGASSAGSSGGGGGC
jgi:hypothetical protein